MQRLLLSPIMILVLLASDVPAPAENQQSATLGAAELACVVELAILADPMGFQCPVKVVANDKGLVLRGYVPHPAAKTRLLAVAQKCCSIPVDDQMLIQSNMAIGLIGKAPADLADQARARLKKQRGDESQGIEVQLNNRGQVQLSGRVKTLEDKTSCSRCLRGLPGCRGIQNDLVLLSAVPPGRVTPPIQTPVIGTPATVTFDDDPPPTRK